MKTPHAEKVIFWQEHILKAKQHSHGIQSYLDLHNLPQSSFYKWQKKLLDLKSTNKEIKKTNSVFLPVVVSKSVIAETTCKPQNNLPDPKWVAEVLANLFLGLV